ncbi:hypothetical protein ACFVP3_23495 [Streptomyces sp. NPDC057806]|uniref:hypothetical protein n=1 Tax=Streptomyces sp. NPDC057806 TaxID=3346255 RepID=UPI00367569E5
MSTDKLPGIPAGPIATEPLDYPTPGVFPSATEREGILRDAFRAAGVGLGAYDDRIAHWLAMVSDWSTFAVIVSWVARAASREETPAATLHPAAPDVAELLARAHSFEIPWPGQWRPLLLQRSHAGGDRWWIGDREGRRWHRDLGFVYEAQNEEERSRTGTRFPLAEAWSLAQRIASGQVGP